MTSTTDRGSPPPPFRPASNRQANAGPPVAIDADFVPALSSVDDPELGVNVVDLGLVYGAAWAGAGIFVRMTMTSPSCPMAEMLAAEVRSALRRQFPEAPVTVDVCCDPPWSPVRISEAGRRQLGWVTQPDVRPRRLLSWPKIFSGNGRRH